MMRKLMLLTLLAALLMLVSFDVYAVTTLTYASNGPEHSVRGAAEKLFLDEIEKQSKGQIKVHAFWANTLMSGNELLKGCADGVADMVFMNSNFYPKALPHNSALGVNEFGPSKGRTLVTMFKDLFLNVPELIEDFKKHNQFPVYFYATDCNAFISNRQIKDVEGLKGMKLRASSRWKLADFKDLGATPVSVPWADCYMALQSGTVDSIMTSVESIHRGRLYEVGEHLWVWDKMSFPIPYLITMNIKKFNKLSEEEQAAILRAGEIASQKFAERFDAALAGEIEEIKNAGCKVSYATEADYIAWGKLPSASGGNMKTWADEARVLGIAEPEKVAAKISEIFRSYYSKEE